MRYFFIFYFILFVSNLFCYKYELTDTLGYRLGKFDDRLLIISDIDYSKGGKSIRDYNWDRWVRDFRSDVLIRDSSDGIIQEFKLGRIYTRFTPLTLKKSRFPYNYAEEYQFGFKWSLIFDSWFKKVTFLINRVDLDNLTDKDDPKTDKYFVAGRVELNPYDNIDLGLSFVNQHSAYRGLNYKSSGFLSGTINEENYPSELYIKFMDNSPDDNVGGSAVYEMKVYINGVYYPSLSIKGGSEVEAGSEVSVINSGAICYSDHWEVNGKNYLIYKIKLPNNGQKIRSVKFVFDIANDYLIMASPDSYWTEYKSTVLLSSDKNVKDYSNRGKRVAYFSFITGESLYGVDVHFNIFGIDITSEYVLNLRYRKYPNLNGEDYKITGNAFSFKFTRELSRRFGLGGEFFYLDKNYDCTFSVEDDDDNDYKPDIADDDGVNFILYNDINNNGIKDYTEDFLLFDADDDKFRNVPDNNNNGVPDDVEDDNLPDTPYYLGEKGFNIYLKFNNPVLNFENETGYRLNIKYNNDSAKKIYNYSEYRKQLFEWLKFVFRNRVEYINDKIPNNLANWNDPLLFQDNLLDRFITILKFDFIKNLIMENKILYELNISDFLNSDITDKKRDIDSINIFKLGYNLKPDILPKFLIRPLYKTRFNYAYYFTENSGKVDKIKTLSDYLIFEIIYNFSNPTRMMAGYQKSFNTDYLNNYENNISDTFILEVAYKGQFWNRDLALVNRDYEKDIREDFKYRKIYLESYFNW